MKTNLYLISTLIAVTFFFSKSVLADSNILINDMNGHSYQRIDQNMTWRNAKTYCENLGGYLATATSEEENIFIFDRLVRATHTNINYWLGATDDADEGVWQWVTGEVWNYTNWGSGNPNNFSNIQHYLHYSSSHPAFKWDDAQNDHSPNYPICEWDAKAIDLTGNEFLESPSQDSVESGLGLIRGWACNASEITMLIDKSLEFTAAYGTSRADTESVCGDTNNGFGMTINWSLFSRGTHTLQAFADGVEFANVAFMVSSPFNVEFLTDAHGTGIAKDFPTKGQDTLLEWSQTHQNFVITEVVNSTNSENTFLSYCGFGNWVDHPVLSGKGTCDSFGDNVTGRRLSEANSKTTCGGFYKTTAYQDESGQTVAIFISNGVCEADREIFRIDPPEPIAQHCLKYGGTGNYLWSYSLLTAPFGGYPTTGIACEVEYSLLP